MESETNATWIRTTLNTTLTNRLLHHRQLSAVSPRRHHSDHRRNRADQKNASDYGGNEHGASGEARRVAATRVQVVVDRRDDRVPVLEVVVVHRPQHAAQQTLVLYVVHLVDDGRGVVI